MKNLWICVLVSLLCVTTAGVHAELLLYEGFDYPAGAFTNGLNGGSGWNGAWASVDTGAGKPTFTVDATSLASPIQHLASTGGALRIVGSGDRIYRPVLEFGANGTTIWMSFIAQQLGTAAPNSAIELSRNNMTTLTVATFGSDNGGTANFGASDKSAGSENEISVGTPGSALAPDTDPHLWVLKFDFGAGDADTVTLWYDGVEKGSATMGNLTFQGIGSFHYSGTAGMVYDEIRIGTELGDVVSLPPVAHSPVPDGSVDVDSNVVSSVSWYSPQQDANGDPDADPNIIDVTYDVYWSTVDANFIGESAASVGQAAQSFDPAVDATPTLPAITTDTTYYWRVDSVVIWDVNSFLEPGTYTVIPGTPDTYLQTVEGDSWQFTTLPANPAPTVDAGDNLYTSLALLDSPNAIALNGIVSDPGDSPTILWSVLTGVADYPGGTQSFPGGAGSAVTTFQSDTAGRFVLQLTADDGYNPPVSDTMEVLVIEDACEAAKANPDGYTQLVFDLNNDCVVNLPDLAIVAAEWLTDALLDVPVPYTGIVPDLELDVDIYIEAEDVYLLGSTDPNWASDAPVTTYGGGSNVGIGIDDTTEGLFGGAQLAYGHATGGDYITYEVDIPVAGNYTVYVYYARPDVGSGTDGEPVAQFGTKDNPVLYGAFVLPSTGGWTNHQIHSGTLNFTTTGTHLVRLTFAGGRCNTDFIGLKKQ